MEAMKICKQKCELFFDAKYIEKEKQVSHILLKAGDIGLQRYNSWELPEADKKKTTIVLYDKSLKNMASHRNILGWLDSGCRQ